MVIFHITTRDAWREAQHGGSYRPASLETEGFIHFSLDRQWLATANRFYRGRPDLVLLRVLTDRLRSPLLEEPADGDRFPHLYGELNLDAVDAVFDLPVSEDGTFVAKERGAP